MAVQEVAEDHGREQPPGRADHGGGGVARRLDRGPDEEGRLQALATDGDEGGGDKGAGAHGEGGVELALQLALEVPRRPAHPEHHPRHETDGQDRHQAAEALLGPERHGPRGERKQGAGGQAGAHRGGHAEPDGAEPVPSATADQVRDQDAHHEGGFQSLPEADQVVGEHR